MPARAGWIGNQLTRRFRKNFFLNASFDKLFRDELRSPEASTSPYIADPLEQDWFQNHSLDVANRQETNPETNFILDTGSRFNQIIEWLPGATLRLGLRFQF